MIALTKTGTTSTGAASVYYASKSGAVGGANFATGACPSGVDDTAALQALASIAGPKTIVIDRVCPISQPLNFNSDTVFDFGATGALVLIFGSNCNVLQDATYSLVTGTYTTQNVEFRNLRINGNGYSNGNFQQIHHRPDGWNVGLRITGAKNVTLYNPIFRNCRTFCFYANNVVDVHLHKATFDQSPDAPFGNLDGFKFQGPFDDVSVNGATGFSQDDFGSAVSCDIFWPTLAQVPAGGNETNTGVDVRATFGPITNGVFRDFVFLNTKSCLRVMSRNALVDNIKFENIGGTTNGGIVIIDNFSIGGQNPAFLYDQTAGDGQGNIGSLSFDNVNVQGGPDIYNLGFFAIGGRIRNISFTRCTFTALPNGHEPFRVHATALIENLFLDRVTVDYLGTAALDAIACYGQVENLFLSTVRYVRSNYSAASSVLRQITGRTGIVRSSGIYTKNIGSDLVIAGGVLGEVQSASVTKRLDTNSRGHLDLNGATMSTATMSNFAGGLIPSIGGTITTKNGDAFTATNVPAAVAGIDALRSAILATGDTISVAAYNQNITVENNLRAAGVWGKLRIWYPMEGTTALSKGYNALNVFNSDAAKRIAWTGSYDFAGVGVKPTAAGAYGNTFYGSFGQTPNDNRGMAFVSCEDIQTGRDFGAVNAVNEGDQMHVEYTDGTVYAGIGGLSAANTAGNSTALWIVQNVNGIVTTYRNNIAFATTSSSINVALTAPYYIGNINAAGTPSGLPSMRRGSDYMAFDALTQAQIDVLYTNLQSKMASKGVTI